MSWTSERTISTICHLTKNIFTLRSKYLGVYWWKSAVLCLMSKFEHWLLRLVNHAYRFQKFKDMIQFKKFSFLFSFPPPFFFGSVTVVREKSSHYKKIGESAFSGRSYQTAICLKAKFLEEFKVGTFSNSFYFSLILFILDCKSLISVSNITILILLLSMFLQS